MTDPLEALSAPFPRDQISWRAQSVTKAGDKALALAYIDARDVMDRLDAAVGPAHWQDRYEVHGSRVICYLSINLGEWVTKADGAGDTAVEAEKGGLSDAFKRAAVKWGIGRYLYDIPAPWVPCETTEYNGKKQWKRWTADPWSFVKGNPGTPKPQAADPERTHKATQLRDDLTRQINDCADAEYLATLGNDVRFKDAVGGLPEKDREAVRHAYALQRAALNAGLEGELKINEAAE